MGQKRSVWEKYDGLVEPEKPMEEIGLGCDSVIYQEPEYTPQDMEDYVMKVVCIFSIRIWNKLLFRWAIPWKRC